MTWKVEWVDAAAKELRKLDKQIQRDILRYFRKRIATDDDPHRLGKPLVGNKSGLWRYRVRDYRIICNITDDTLTVLVLRVGHRKNVYEKNQN